jgi:NAD(P)-dependent dehydrogenase (short-subunit alcohol dehydrogenase family)
MSRPSPPDGPAQTVLITGGGGGVGRATALALAADGWHVALLGRDEDRLREAAEIVGPRALVVPGDVTERPSIEAALDALRGRVPAPTALVHAAGIAQAAGLVPPDDDLWERTMAVNARGAWICATACLPAMVLRGEGDLVFVASTAALRGYRYTAAYVASKHATLGLARSLAADVGSKGIRVHVVCPGFLDTPMTETTVERIVATTHLDAAAARASLAAMNASGRLIEPEEVAAVIRRRLRDRVDDLEPVVLE